MSFGFVMSDLPISTELFNRAMAGNRDAQFELAEIYMQSENEEHVALARHAIENPFLIIPHPKNADHPLCGECGIFAASTLVVPAPGSIPEWPACKGMFPTTHCQSCARADDENEYVFEAANCRCGILWSTRRLTCNQCHKAKNE